MISASAKVAPSPQNPNSAFNLSHETLSMIQTMPEPLNEHQIQLLMEQGFTRGLCDSMNAMRQIFALRIWVVDNSGSMTTRDGNRFVPTNSGALQKTTCSRWEEIVECVQDHVKLAGLIQAPTQFRLLNNPGSRDTKQFSVGLDSTTSTISADVYNALYTIQRAYPCEATPLTRHVCEIHRQVAQMTPELNRVGRKVVIVIATDGLPSDSWGHSKLKQRKEFVEALRLLEGLPVWVVIRLCTDDERIVEFYNSLDAELELSLDLLDDFHGEALEVTHENPWLNYALPLHRLREMGYHDRVFDMLDERLLTKSEMRDFCNLLFGQMDGTPDPAVDWKRFAESVELALTKENNQWNPTKRRSTPWINMKRLNRLYGKKFAWLPFR